MRPVELFRFCPRCGAARPDENHAQSPFRCGACQLVFFFNPTVAAGGLVFDTDGRALLIRRAKDPSVGKLGVPGGFIDFGVDLIKGGMATYGITTNPVLIPGRVEPRYDEFLTFIGVSVHETTGENHYLDATLAYRRACLNAIEYLGKFGYSPEQAYLLLGSAPIEGRISGVGLKP